MVKDWGAGYAFNRWVQMGHVFTPSAWARGFLDGLRAAAQRRARLALRETGVRLEDVGFESLGYSDDPDDEPSGREQAIHDALGRVWDARREEYRW